MREAEPMLGIHGKHPVGSHGGMAIQSGVNHEDRPIRVPPGSRAVARNSRRICALRATGAADPPSYPSGKDIFR